MNSRLEEKQQINDFVKKLNKRKKELYKTRIYLGNSLTPINVITFVRVPE